MAKTIANEEIQTHKYVNAIIKKIRKEYYFDAHFIIDHLTTLHPDVYLDTARRLSKTKENQLNGHIAKIIKQNKDIQQVGKSWSKNVNNRPSVCSCWQKK